MVITTRKSRVQIPIYQNKVFSHHLLLVVVAAGEGGGHGARAPLTVPRKTAVLGCAAWRPVKKHSNVSSNPARTSNKSICTSFNSKRCCLRLIVVENGIDIECQAPIGLKNKIRNQERSSQQNIKAKATGLNKVRS